MKNVNGKSVILTSIISLAFAMSGNSQANIYKWTDENGQTHYTAQPPVQKELRVKAKDIEDKIQANAGKYRASSEVKTVATDVDASNRDDANNDKANKEELSGPNKQLIEYCNGQRNNIKQLKKNFRNVWIDAEGKRTALSQEQRKEKLSILESQIKTDCEGVLASSKS